jgi:hypothetical protein
MDRKVTVALDNLDDKIAFKIRTMKYNTTPTEVVKKAIKIWMHEHPEVGVSANTIG